MLFFTSALLSLVVSAFAAPLASQDSHGRGDLLRFPPFIHKGLLCNLPIPVIQKILCTRQGTPDLSIDTPLGTARGATDNGDVVRFSVKYASASRWQPSSVVTSWQLPNGLTDPSGLPLACPQDNLDDSSMSEDCLSMILFVPNNLPANAPTLVWIHGGSFAVGSATAPGLDGSNLATATNSIVAVIQYRLGALGFFAPNGQTNLGVKDTVNALKFLNKVLPSFGGDPSKVSLAGQSAGASMIRTLLAVPSAASLFRSAVLQSDTMDYGFYSPSIQQSLQQFFNTFISCSPSDNACLNALSIDAIISAQDNYSNNAAFSVTPAATVAEPIRPVRDGSFVTNSLDSSMAFPHVTKPLLISTVHHEAGFTIYGLYNDGLDASGYVNALNAAYGSNSTDILLQNPNYAIPANAESAGTDVRPQLQVVGTDQVWRCPTWTFARNWVSNGGTAYVAEYLVGASYPGNDAVSFCTDAGVVCHQDDIMIVFGTVPNPSPAQSAVTAEIQARYKAFLNNNNPNTDGHASWTPATNTDVHALQLGGVGEVPAGACEPSLWGAAVPYDYQVFNI
ncbi:Alpha/Beta hydrolase protein [Abortiporus biennis]|nr:Alpha/Beta hydrolase protein [Abortiporus biennis]